MTVGLSSIEKSLLRGKDDDNQAPHLAQAVLEGKFREALTSPIARNFFRIASPTFDRPFDQSFTFPTTEDEELIRIILAVACLHAFVQANWTGPDLDLRSSDVISSISTPSTLSDDLLNQTALSELAIAGEPAYHLTKVAAFLRLAQVLLAPPFTQCGSAPWWRLRVALVHQEVLDNPVPPSDTLLESAESSRPLYSAEPDLAARLVLEQGLLQHQLSNGKLASELFVRAAKTTGLVYELTGALGKRTKFQQFDLSQLVLLAESHLGTEDDGTQKSVPESLPSRPTKNTEDEKTSRSLGVMALSDSDRLPIPETLVLNDDTLLEQTKFTSSNPCAPGSLLGHIDPSSQPPLHPLDQSILLSMCLNVKNTSPSHGLTNEQMSPYVARVITHPRNWSIHTMALLVRSRLESLRTRTVERSTLQLQALIDQMPTADSTLQERLLYFHSLPLPSKWELERELALRYLSLGVVKSALEIFERLEMWEEVVKCWTALERPEKGIAIVRDLLEGRKKEAEEVISLGKPITADKRQAHDHAREAKLWCLLGDLEPTHAAEHYEKAWRISRETSGRAMRSLGGYYFARGKYPEAMVSLKRAVAINSLLSRSWFILGCACMRVEDWEEAKNAFSRCVAIDEEDGESWNNLASMYLRIGTAKAEKKAADESDESKAEKDISITSSSSVPFGNKLLAFRALKQGLRFSYDNWRMWYNYMVVSMDVGELSEACRALGRVVEETVDKVGAKAVDEDVLERLVNAVTRAPAEAGTGAVDGGGDATAITMSPNEGHGLLRNVANLFENTVLPRVSSPRIFRAYGRLLTWQSRWEEALKAYLDAYRCGVAATVHESVAEAESGTGDAALQRWREGVREVEEMVAVLINFGPRAGQPEHGDGSGNLKKWRMQGRSIVRTFMGRTKDFEDEPEWERLADLEKDLRSE